MFTDKFLFGPALVEAIQLEKEAIFPRVLLSDAVIKYVSTTTACSNLVLRDSDGKAFLHYLGGLSGFAHMKPHRVFVQNGLNENANRAHERQKYEWLAQYHNFVANYMSRNELEISVDRLDAFSPLPTTLLSDAIKKRTSYFIPC